MSLGHKRTGYVLQNALDRLGVEVQVLRHGKFKGAVEPYMLESMSEENRHRLRRYRFNMEFRLEDILFQGYSRSGPTVFCG